MARKSAAKKVPDDLSKTLVGKSIGAFEVVRYIDRGASAFVFEGKAEDGSQVALKAFDPDFISKYDPEVQVARIERQLLLKGKRHDHLIDILDGGHCSKTDLHYLVMPYLPVSSLDKTLDKVPRESIWPIISQIASAARFLEDLDMCHRDIKPANIVVTGDKMDKAILLDLGVVTPLGLHDLTDTSHTKEFVGTTRYSPPEFLLRDEGDSKEGYRAVTFYQLGAVLHDLIMRRMLFHDKEKPYARLVRAVLLEEPVIDATEIPSDLGRLARMCLIKDPERRFKSLTWESFVPRASKLPEIEDARKRVRALKKAIGSSPSVSTSREERARFKKVVDGLKGQLKQACLDDVEVFPPVVATTHDHDDRSAIITLSFHSSSRHRLQSKLSFYLRIDLLDASSWTFSVHAAVALHSHDTAPDLKAAPFNLISNGVAEGELSEVGRKASYSAVVAGLEETAVGLRELDATLWIEMEGM